MDIPIAVEPNPYSPGREMCGRCFEKNLEKSSEKKFEKFEKFQLLTRCLRTPSRRSKVSL
jgi:hypothetical protein